MSMRETTTIVESNTGKGKTASGIIQQSNEMEMKQNKYNETTMIVLEGDE